MSWFDDNSPEVGGNGDAATFDAPASVATDPNYQAWARQNPGVSYAQSPWGNPSAPGSSAYTGGNNAVPATAAPAATSTAPPPSGSVGHNGTYNGMTREQYRDAWMSSGVNSIQGMKDWLAKNGGQLVSDNGTVITPFGETLDMGGNAKGSAAGHGALIPIWGGGGSAAAPSTTAPSNQVLSMQGGMGGYGGGGAGGGASVPAVAHTSSVTWGGPSSIGPFTATPFAAPSFEDAQNDPGYQFALKQGLQALTNSASANGGLLAGATGKALIDYGQQAAAQQYQNVYNRALTTNQANNASALSAYNANTAAQLGIGNLDLGYTNAGNEAQSIANQYALGQGQLGLGYYQAGNAYNLGLGNLALGNLEANNSYQLGLGNQQLGWANYGLNANNQDFNQQYSLAQLGLTAAGQSGLYGSSYANNASNAYTGIGNAQAGGAIGGGNAVGGALGSVGNGLIGYGLYRGMGNG